MISPLQFADCGFQDVQDFIVRNHYSGYLPPDGLSSFYFSARLDGQLVGACVIGHPAGAPKPVLKSPFDGKEFNRELTRLAMTDDMRKMMPSHRQGEFNSGSWFVGKSLRWLQENTDLLGLISYADPEHDHDGGIYRATNWIYTSVGYPSILLNVDGVEMHRKSASNKFGTDSVTLLRQQGHEVETRSPAPKHRYVYYLQKGLELYHRYQPVAFVAVLLLALLLNPMFGFGAHAALATRAALKKFAKWFAKGAS